MDPNHIRETDLYLPYELFLIKYKHLIKVQLEKEKLLYDIFKFEDFKNNPDTCLVSKFIIATVNDTLDNINFPIKPPVEFSKSESLTKLLEYVMKCIDH